ncbi:MAG: 16S rRNA (guanine(966)-N(2))-methyltransferase RsmD [Phycisphaerales bacterium]
MRIIAGEYRRRLIQALPGLTTRPMPDRVKESLFSMLGTRIEGAAVLDLFAGSGALGLESLSRGAASCLFVERDRSAAAILERNIETLGCADRAQVVLGDALGMSIVARAPEGIDLIFLDPPYPIVRQLTGWDRVRQQASALAPKLAADGFLVLRTPWPFSHDPDPALAPGEGEAPNPAALAAGTGKRRTTKPKKYKRERPRWDELAADGRKEKLERDGSMGKSSAAPQWLYRIDKPEGGTEAAASAAAPADEAEAGAEDDGVVVTGAHEITEAQRTPGDPAIPGLRGPETHAYGTTAVHWYMRANA